MVESGVINTVVETHIRQIGEIVEEREPAHASTSASLTDEW
jgi:hypothetical protein